MSHDYPDRENTMTHATLQQALDDLDMVAGGYGGALHPSDFARVKRSADALRKALQSQAAAEPEHYGMEPWEKTAIAPVATMVFPKHSPDKPFIALGDCANLYPDAAQTKPLYNTPPDTQSDNPLLNDYVQKCVDADRAKWQPVLHRALVALNDIGTMTTYCSEPSSIWKRFYASATGGDYVDLREFRERTKSAIAEIEALGVKG
ncbi:MAG: hypothetical protein WAW73_09425 [Rhodoferax sp.]